MLSYKRPYNSRWERKFIARYIDSVKGMKQDSFGNRYIFVGKNPDTMFSCHTDTVHTSAGKQTVYVDTFQGMMYADGKKSNCLGADDATGIWLMLKMIEQQKTGLYIFHRGEEVGGLGSSWIAKHNKLLFSHITKAIAFDRKGYTDVITYQGGSRCCSDKFAEDLATKLGMKFKPEDGGVFTDTANYTALIPECTNISVGYDFQHTANECQDYRFAEDLLERLLAIDFSTLPVSRKTTDVDELWSTSSYGGYYDNYGSGYGKGYTNNQDWADSLDIIECPRFSSFAQAEEFAWQHPSSVASEVLDLQRKVAKMERLANRKAKRRADAYLKHIKGVK